MTSLNSRQKSVFLEILEEASNRAFEEWKQAYYAMRKRERELDAMVANGERAANLYYSDDAEWKSLRKAEREASAKKFEVAGVVSKIKDADRSITF